MKIGANTLANIVFAYSRQCKTIYDNSLFDAAYYHGQNHVKTGSALQLLRHYLVKGFRQGYNPHRLFNTAYFLQNNPEVMKSGANPLIHYLKNGFRLKQNPHPLFDASYYLNNNPDVAEAGINPLIHYVQYGGREKRNPHPLFDTTYYLSENHGAVGVEANPLVHYLQFGYKEKANPHPLFNTSYYLENNPDVVLSGLNPLIHFVLYGGREKRNPHPLFDASYYLSEIHSSSEEINPLLHYLQFGCKEKSNPHLLFNTSYYLEKNPDVARSEMNPLMHFILYGCREGRDPHRLFHSLFYSRKYADKTDNRWNPLLHFILYGLTERTDPHPLFNTTYYLEEHPEAIELGINPLVHFLERGYKKETDVYLYRKCQVRKIKNILILQLGFPRFDYDAGSLRIYHLIRMLVASGYNVILWAPEGPEHERYTKEFTELNIKLPYQENGIKAYLQENGSLVDLAILYRVDAARLYLDIIMALTDAKIIFDTVDLHYLREERKAKVLNEDVDSAIKSQELHYARCADKVLVVSPVEKEILELEGVKEKVSIVSIIHTLRPFSRSFAERTGLMFIGGFEHQPNVDGVLWFAQKIFPIIQKHLPGIRLYIVGTSPPASVFSLASADIAVTGYVADVTLYFDMARVFVCPLRYGAGVKGKIGQSMAFRLPVVTTSIGAEGMYLEDGVNAMIADDEQLFAHKVIELYQNQKLWEQLSHRAGLVIEQYFSPVVVKKALLKAIESDRG